MRRRDGKPLVSGHVTRSVDSLPSTERVYNTRSSIAFVYIETTGALSRIRHTRRTYPEEGDQCPGAEHASVNRGYVETKAQFHFAVLQIVELVPPDGKAPPRLVASR